MQISSKSDIGLKRSQNEDSFYTGYLSDNSALAVVCDGMGGASAGNVASATAVDLIVKYIEKSYSRKLNRDSLLSLMKSAVISANMSIYEMSQKDENYEGMGTTAVVLIVRNSFALICHVGDSRAYHIGDEVTQITRDHSVVQTLLEDGKLTPEEAKNHPNKNVITRALGVEKDVVPDCTEIPLEIGQTVLLCSDGLSNYVDEKTIFEIVKNNDTDKVADVLVDKANENGGGDNITAIAVTL
ncbi:MAG: Stp1/IreP family PP2C-type Ser/Thr phosphatase [Clostridia bacterium]|nr:Stp1/IreP family PP2C-type Ser/Thr phosphatase [Clostridia bacterium]